MKKEATLLAGLLLIFPGVALAAHDSFSGSCVNCHTMHNSSDGATIGPEGQPIGGGMTCAQCHIGRPNGTNGRATDSPLAPQVSSTVNTTSGGYFVGTSGRANQHDVAEMAAKDTTFTNVPGGPVYDGSWDGAVGGQIYCESCHDSAVGHSPGTAATATGSSSSSYRMLGRNSKWVAGTGSANFETGGAADRNSYDATTMNALCGDCHQTFHATGVAGQGVGIGATPNAWVRHPTGVAIQAELGTSYSFTGSQTVPTGWDAGDVREDVVMCISCHRPHGSEYQDLLRFSYSANKAANNTTASVGCEDCHGAM